MQHTNKRFYDRIEYEGSNESGANLTANLSSMLVDQNEEDAYAPVISLAYTRHAPFLSNPFDKKDVQYASFYLEDQNNLSMSLSDL